jgi:hypothetical protein
MPYICFCQIARRVFITAIWLTTLELIIQEIVKTDDKLKAFHFGSVDATKIHSAKWGNWRRLIILEPLRLSEK